MSQILEIQTFHEHCFDECAIYRVYVVISVCICMLLLKSYFKKLPVQAVWSPFPHFLVLTFQIGGSKIPIRSFCSILLPFIEPDYRFLSEIDARFTTFLNH